MIKTKVQKQNLKMKKLKSFKLIIIFLTLIARASKTMAECNKSKIKN